MKQYNEIYPAEGWADKIQKFLNRVVSQKPNMYAKTKKRYHNLALVLLDCVSMILPLIEEDSLVPESTDEFNELASGNDCEIYNKLSSMIQEFQRAENFSTLKPTPHESPPRVSSNQENHESVYSYHDTCEYYDSILKEASILNFGFSEVNACSKLMYKWFHTRFMPDIQDPDFKCQIRYLPTWISSFIIIYGKYYHANKLPAFKNMIDKWCNKIEIGEGGIYTMPYEMYRLDHDFKEGKSQPSDYTLDAVIIADLLMSGYLFKLTDSEYDGMVRYNPGDVADIVRERNPALLPKIRTRITRRQELVREIGLTPVGGTDVDE